jgi:hypothetical protein
VAVLKVMKDRLKKVENMRARRIVEMDYGPASRGAPPFLAI